MCSRKRNEVKTKASSQKAFGRMLIMLKWDDGSKLVHSLILSTRYAFEIFHKRKFLLEGLVGIS